MNDRKLCRNTRRRWIGGVCAGIADHLALPVFLVRLMALLLLCTPVAPLAVVGYIIAVFVIPQCPRPPERTDPEQEQFERSVQSSPSATFGHVRHRIRELEHRIRRLEAYVTSPEYEFDQDMAGKR